MSQKCSFYPTCENLRKTINRIQLSNILKLTNAMFIIVQYFTYLTADTFFRNHEKKVSHKVTQEPQTGA